MKTIYTLILAALISFTAAAQSFYSLQSAALGTNSIGSNANLSLPVPLSTYTVTNVGISPIYYLATNYATNFVQFTIPVTNYLWFTNTFIKSNSVVGVGVKSWTIDEMVHATNTAEYYVTNGAYLSPSYTYATNYLYTTNSGGTNTIATNIVSSPVFVIVTNSTYYTNAYYTTASGTNISYSKTQVFITNAAVIITNHQFFNLITPVPFSITGTNSNVVNYTNYGASVIDVRQSASVAIKVGFNLVTTSAQLVTFSYKPNIDSVVEASIPNQTFALLANGTNPVATNVTVTAGPLGFLVFTGITNANPVALTNLFFKFAQKVNAP